MRLFKVCKCTLKRILMAVRRRLAVSAVLKICISTVVAVSFVALYLTSQKCTPELLNVNKDAAHYSLQLNRTVRLPSVCTNELCRSDYARHLHAKGSHPIPAIRHILWRNESVSEYFADHLRSWLQIHPDWTYVLWRDKDLEPFVAAHFPDLLARYRSLPEDIMRIDMIRYMILFKFGGTYADLDYTLVRSLDSFRRFHAVITREPEAHSLEFLGLTWPAKLMANPAFMMTSRGHSFYSYAIQSLGCKRITGVIHYAGPIGLADMIQGYESRLPVATNAMETVYVPPSYSFFPYPDNRMNNSRSATIQVRFGRLRLACQLMLRRGASTLNYRLRQFCADLNNMDPITDRSQPVFAIHDLTKSGASYDGVGAKFYNERLTDMRKVIRNLKLSSDFLASPMHARIVIKANLF